MKFVVYRDQSYKSYKSYKNEMSLAAQQVLERYEEQETRWMRLNRWVNVYYDDLAKDLPAAIDDFPLFIFGFVLSIRIRNN